MKYFITLLAVLFFVPVYPRDLYVYNNMSSTLFYKIGARPANGNYYPLLYSKGPMGDFVSLQPLSSATYSNATGFPFYSPNSVPIIITWERMLTATSIPINTTSTLAQNLFGTTHRYSQFKFYIEDSNGIVIGSGNIDPIDLDNPLGTPLGENIYTTYFPLGDDVFVLFDEI